MSALRFRSAARSHPGRMRSQNEDTYVDRPDLGLWAVADGMGGHDRGALASGIIRDALDALPRAESAPVHLRNVEHALAACHADLRERAVPGQICGSTVVALLAFDGHFACLWAGDSRLYRLRAGRLEQLTTDHSVVQEMVAAGTLAPEAVRGHPQANRITRALGAGEQLELDALQDRIEAGDRFLLCSDGLSGEVEDAALAEVLTADALDACVDELLARALEAGGRDNVTLVLVAAESGTLDDTLP
jgi:serine/threonine protein phosphatase Stp1